MGLMELFVEEASLRIHVIELRYFTRPCIFKKKKTHDQYCRKCIFRHTTEKSLRT